MSIEESIARHCGDYREEDFPENEYADLIHKFGCTDITPEQLARLEELDERAELATKEEAGKEGE